jgi:hypothetical protein
VLWERFEFSRVDPNLHRRSGFGSLLYGPCARGLLMSRFVRLPAFLRFGPGLAVALAGMPFCSAAAVQHSPSVHAVVPQSRVLRSSLDLPEESYTSRASRIVPLSIPSLGAPTSSRRILIGAIVGGVGLAIAGSQLCERGESCTKTVIGFGLIGATLGAVVGGLLGGSGSENE